MIRRHATKMIVALLAMFVGSAAAVEIDWQVIASGGQINGSSPSYRLSGTVGQSSVGVGSIPSYGLSGGFWQSSVTAAGCCVAKRGNVDGSADDAVTLGDLTVMIDHLFISLEPLECWEEANLDGSLPEGPGSVTLGDLTVLIDHLFISLEPLAAC